MLNSDNSTQTCFPPAVSPDFQNTITTLPLKRLSKQHLMVRRQKEKLPQLIIFCNIYTHHHFYTINVQYASEYTCIKVYSDDVFTFLSLM